jgi:hypothetical protein
MTIRSGKEYGMDADYTVIVNQRPPAAPQDRLPALDAEPRFHGPGRRLLFPEKAHEHMTAFPAPSPDNTAGSFGHLVDFRPDYGSQGPASMARDVRRNREIHRDRAT